MRISTKGRYSLEALLYMAVSPGDGYLSTRTIAEATGISEGYLEQLFILLRRAGIVRGVRGPQGGCVPGREPKKITVGDILRAVEGDMRPADCVPADYESEDSDRSTACPMSAGCGSRKIWADLNREINRCLDSISLADLAKSFADIEKAGYVL